MLKIYGRTNSINVMKVLWACAELDLPFAREDVGGHFGRNRESWYLAMNPNAVVPTIDEDGFVLWESNAVVRYLAAKHAAGGLWPLDPRARALADRWMDWQQTVLQGAMLAVFLGLIRTPSEQRDQGAIEASRQKSIAALQILDGALSRSDYVGGAGFTIGDIPVGASVHRWMALPVERPSMPHLERYYERLRQRPGYRLHVAQPLS